MKVDFLMKPGIVFLGLLSLLFFSACNKDNIEDLINNNGNSEETATTVDESIEANADDHEVADDYVWDVADAVSIQLNGSSVTVSGSGAVADGSKVTISKAGIYLIKGTLDDGQIIVNANAEGTVKLVFNTVNITSSSSAPVYIKNSEKTVIILADNTENVLTDGSTYVYDDAEDEEPNATIFSKENLSLAGNGTLTVNANFNDAINSKDGLIIKNGTYILNALDDGIRGKDYLVVRDGNLTISAGGDGMKSDNDNDGSLGYVLIEDGIFNIISGNDAIQAETDISIAYANMTIKSGGGSSSSVSSSSSAKGLKAGVSIIIDDGIFSINSADDAINSNSGVVINGGTLTISSGDDGIHSDNTLAVNAGTITISKSYEGLEGKIITVNSGEIYITSSDDGLNATSGSSSTYGGWPGGGGGGMNSAEEGVYIFMNGGKIVMNANGDGVDSNGSVTMTGGVILVNGPTGNDNGAIDYNGSFSMNGGVLIAAGSSGMAEAPSSGSQYSVLLKLSSTQSAGSLFHVESTDGSDLVTFKPSKKYASVVFSSPELIKGSSYYIYLGGSSTGTLVDGIYEDGVYTSGSMHTKFTISSIVTSLR